MRMKNIVPYIKDSSGSAVAAVALVDEAVGIGGVVVVGSVL